MIDGEVACALKQNINKRKCNCSLWKATQNVNRTVYRLLDFQQLATDGGQKVVMVQVPLVQSAANEMVEEQLNTGLGGKHFVRQTIESLLLECSVGGYEKCVVGAGDVLCNLCGVEESVKKNIVRSYMI